MLFNHASLSLFHWPHPVKWHNTHAAYSPCSEQTRVPQVFHNPSNVPWGEIKEREGQNYMLQCVRACVRACVCACMYVCAFVCVCYYLMMSAGMIMNNPRNQTGYSILHMMYHKYGQHTQRPGLSNPLKFQWSYCITLKLCVLGMFPFTNNKQVVNTFQHLICPNIDTKL